MNRIWLKIKCYLGYHKWHLYLSREKAWPNISLKEMKTIGIGVRCKHCSTPRPESKFD